MIKVIRGKENPHRKVIMSKRMWDILISDLG